MCASGLRNFYLEKVSCFVALDAQAKLAQVRIKRTLGQSLGPGAWAPETAARSTPRPEKEQSRARTL